MTDTSSLAQTIRAHALRMTSTGGSSHIASILSVADIIAVLYGKVLRFRPSEPRWGGRDRFILSKGHAGACVYAALAECGFFDVSMLGQHYRNGSVMSGHISHRGIPGVEFSTGSLGHGLPVAAGIALAGIKEEADFRVFTVLSDGECDEGSNWEALLFAAHHKLTNLTVIIDRNWYQSIESTESTLALEPLADKIKAFGWAVSCVDGHNHAELTSALLPYKNGTGPTCIIANTIKGKGVSFMEDEIVWHYRSPQGRELIDALREVSGA